jgi:hypothetical protein
VTPEALADPANDEGARSPGGSFAFKPEWRRQRPRVGGKSRASEFPQDGLGAQLAHAKRPTNLGAACASSSRATTADAAPKGGSRAGAQWTRAEAANTAHAGQEAENASFFPYTRKFVPAF